MNLVYIGSGISCLTFGKEYWCLSVEGGEVVTIDDEETVSTYKRELFIDKGDWREIQINKLIK